MDERISDASTRSAPDGGARLPLWLVAVIATVALQTATAFVIRVIPTLGPALAARGGFDEAHVGYLAAANTLGSILFLVAGGPLMRRHGPLRSLQIGLTLAVIGVFGLLVPSLPLAFLACVLMGLGYGPSAPAGTDILHRFAPPHRRALIFSVKQAGVPLGGVLAGLLLPALAAFDIRLALVATAAFVAVLALSVQPARTVTDDERDRSQPVGPAAFLSIANLTEALRSVFAVPGLVRLAAAGACFATAQGCLMAMQVTFFVAELGMSLPLAGSLAALMYTTGIFGRILLGWVSDRLGSGLTTLRLLAVTSALTVGAFATVGPGSPIALPTFLSALAGAFVMSWNGVIMSEIARCSPRGRLNATASGATMVTFLGYVLGPAAFALVLGLTGNWSLCFGLTALVAAFALVLLAGAERRLVPG